MIDAPREARYVLPSVDLADRSWDGEAEIASAFLR